MEEQISYELLSRPEEPADAVETIPSLKFDGTLEERCLDCFQAFESCVKEARRLANLEQTTDLAKSRLRPLARELDEERLRMDVWMLDCGVRSGNLKKALQDADLAKNLASIFPPIHTMLEAIFQELKDMTKEQSIEDFQETGSRITSALNSITASLQELANLRSRIQMAQAIRSNVGPYGKVHEEVMEIGNKFNHQEQQSIEDAGNSKVSSEVGSRYDDGEECTKCHQIFPFQILSFHEETCKGEEVREPERPSTPAIISGMESIDAPAEPAVKFHWTTRALLKGSIEPMESTENRKSRENLKRLDKPSNPSRSISSASASSADNLRWKDRHYLRGSHENCSLGWETYVLDIPRKSHLRRSRKGSDYERESTYSTRTSLTRRVTIHDLLHEDADNPLSPNPKEHQREDIKYVHIPANNMTWIEELIVQYYRLDGDRQDDTDKPRRILMKAMWYGQQQKMRDAIHGRFMRPRCEFVPADDGARQTISGDFVISMPFLHWETIQGLDVMQRVIKNVTASGEYTLSGRRIADLNLGKFGKLILVAARKISEQNLDSDSDSKLLQEYLLGDRPLHVRRSLAQSYYWMRKDNPAEGREQLVYRATSGPLESPRVVMVDQLWLWILDGNLVISSFPRRWGKRKSDPSDMYRSVRERFEDKRDVESVYDLGILLIEECSRFFFDLSRPRDNRPDVLEIFTNAIGDVDGRASKAWTKFHSLIKRNEKMPLIWAPLPDKVIYAKLLESNAEVELLFDTQKIVDELNAMSKVYGDQQTVAENFSAHLGQLAERRNEVSKQTKSRSRQLVRDISERKAELLELIREGLRISAWVKELLDLKQQHADIGKARANLLKDDGAQLRNMEATRRIATDILEECATLAKDSSRQSRYQVIFTIMIIVFLPLCFFAAVFGMNAPELGQGKFQIWKELAIMFPISIWISLSVLGFVFSEDMFEIFKRSFSLEYPFLFGRWKKARRMVDDKVMRREELEKSHWDQQV